MRGKASWTSRCVLVNRIYHLFKKKYIIKQIEGFIDASSHSHLKITSPCSTEYSLSFESCEPFIIYSLIVESSLSVYWHGYQTFTLERLPSCEDCPSLNEVHCSEHLCLVAMFVFPTLVWYFLHFIGLCFRALFPQASRDLQILNDVHVSGKLTFH